MTTEHFFEASQSGDLSHLHEQFDAVPDLDINAKDVHGMSALAYGARNGHVDVVRTLLSKGADKRDVIEQGYGSNHPEIAQLLEVDGTEQPELGVAVDAHGGRQMPDGTISYLGSGNYPQGFPVGPQLGPQYPQQFYEGMPSNFQPGQRRAHQHHGQKDSNANLPPPEIARMIPCKYFPNCKYGEKCVFAHPIAMPAPPQAHPLSPSMSHPPMQPMFYQQLPPGYPYPPYGAAPHQQFIPMAPPTPMQQYGLPPQFGMPHPPMHINGAAPEAGSSHMDGDAQPNGQSDLQNSESPAEGTEQHSSAPHFAEGQGPAVEASKDAGSDEAAQVDNTTEQEQNASGSNNAAHRRQSFNSFLHHHAVPFQPQSNEAFAQRGNGKTRRASPNSASPVNGYNGKRSNQNGERPPCTFFAAGRCRFGDECRFPHILADGTDARPMQAQQRQMYAAQYGAGNAVAPARAGDSNQSNTSAPASAPTGPQADKKSNQSNNTKTSQQSSDKKSSQSNGVVRSNPSKTSTQAAAAASRGQGKKGQASQRIPTVNDFPALSIPSSGAASPQQPSMPSPPTQAANGHLSPAPKVNFSAILSAPAPVKARQAEAQSDESKEVEAEAPQDAHTEDAKEEAENKPTMAAAAANGNTQAKNTTAPANKTQPKANGREKVKGTPSQQTKEAKAPTSKTASQGHDSSSTNEDDFQLVNRSRSNKRTPHGKSDGYAAQAKAVTA